MSQSVTATTCHIEELRAEIRARVAHMMNKFNDYLNDISETHLEDMHRLNYIIEDRDNEIRRLRQEIEDLRFERAKNHRELTYELEELARRTQHDEELARRHQHDLDAEMARELNEKLNGKVGHQNDASSSGQPQINSAIDWAKKYYPTDVGRPLIVTPN